MDLYYKLLNLTEGKYSIHETFELMHHYIIYCVRDMQYNYKITDKLIRTPFPNYDFHHVIVEDDKESHEFVYFFDSINEENDSLRDIEFWKSQYNKYKEFVESMHKQSADFMYCSDDDYPF